MVSRRRPARYALYALFAFAALVGAGGFLLPRRMSVSREVAIGAPAEAVFGRIDSLKRWTDWAPWWTRSPFVESAWDGPDAGKGARVTWTGREGEAGRMAITGSGSPHEVLVAMKFADIGEAMSAFSLAESDDGTTTVTWHFHADFAWNTGQRWFALLYRHSIAQDLERGLAALKEVCESAEAGGTAEEKRAE